MFRYVVAILLILTCPAWAAQGDLEKSPACPDWKNVDVLDLTTAKQIAQANNPSLEAAAQRVSQARERVKQATSTYWPWLDLSGSVAHVDMAENEYDANLAQLKIFNPRATLANPEDYNTAKAGVSWLLFDGFNREFSRKGAKHGVQAFTQSEADVRRQLFSAVAGAFHNAQSAREDIAIARADQDFNQRLMEEAKVRYDVGAGSLSDVLNFEIAVRSAQTQLINSQKSYQVAMIGLAALLGLDDQEFVSKTCLAQLEKETPHDLTPPIAAEYTDLAKKNRPDILQAEAAVAQAKASVGAAKGAFYPTLRLSAYSEASRANDAGFEEEDVENSVAASLSYNLFAGGLNKAQLAEARAAEREAKASLVQKELSVIQDVNEAVASVKAAQEQVKLQEETAGLVQRNRDLVQEEYKAGQTSLVRLNEAQRDLIQVRSNLSRARVYLRQAWHDLYMAAAYMPE
ncbi:TolC family protein [Desulfatibacillum aliphaticivorans]|uniref:TolC family protein n=1 Tax=Desulfatibacillum aliphaticivorans TaxID=218208 RepID=UPI0003F87FAA|nr:TolC family protein [Desulfatibacillum aliphaticivorans]